MSHAHQRVQAAIWVLERRVELAEAAALEAERERDAALERVRVLTGAIRKYEAFELEISINDLSDAWMDSDHRKSSCLNRGEAKEELFDLLEALMDATLEAFGGEHD